MLQTLRFRDVRELAEERLSILLSEGMLLDEAEEATIEWAQAEYGVLLKVVPHAERELPLIGRTGRVLWPVVYREPPVLTTAEVLDALQVAAERIASRHRSKITAPELRVFRDRVLYRLAAQEGISSQDVAEYLGES